MRNIARTARPKRLTQYAFARVLAERIDARRSRLICELFSDHILGTPESKTLGRLKRESFDPDDYADLELLDAFS